jgi:RimJ/RimL family protein N-acetyltransferase
VTEALYGLRVRTPRLELRLPAREEHVELRELARAGIHPPDEMPFGYAWTDEPYSEGWVVDFLEGQIAGWQVDDWNLNLGVWAEGQLAGIQTLHGVDFARTRVVGTGSWLGQAFQRRGYGTEMRAAVLELAFRGLGAEAATSGAMEANRASQRVSEKLGYRVTGLSEVSPRGVPVPHLDLRIERGDWRCPVPVEIEGLEPCLAVFGVSGER